MSFLIYYSLPTSFSRLRNRSSWQVRSIEKGEKPLHQTLQVVQSLRTTGIIFSQHSLNWSYTIKDDWAISFRRSVLSQTSPSFQWNHEMSFHFWLWVEMFEPGTMAIYAQGSWRIQLCIQEFQSCSMMFPLRGLRAPDDLLLFASYTQVQTYLSESQPADWDRWDRLFSVTRPEWIWEWERSSKRLRSTHLLNSGF